MVTKYKTYTFDVDFTNVAPHGMPGSSVQYQAGIRNIFPGKHFRVVSIMWDIRLQTNPNAERIPIAQAFGIEYNLLLRYVSGQKISTPVLQTLNIPNTTGDVVQLYTPGMYKFEGLDFDTDAEILGTFTNNTFDPINCSASVYIQTMEL